MLTGDKTDKIRTLNPYFKDIIGLNVAEMSDNNITTVELFGKYIIETPHFSASKRLNFLKGLGHKIGKVSLLDPEKYPQERYLFFFASHTIKDRTQKSISGRVLHERQERLWQENGSSWD